MGYKASVSSIYLIRAREHAKNALTAPHTCTDHAHMQTLYRARLKGVQKHLPRTAVAAAAPQSGPAPAFPTVSRVDAQFVSLSQASRVNM